MKRKGHKKGFKWDAKGEDVPDGRITKSLQKGFKKMDPAEQRKAAKDRRAALDRLRAHANATDDHEEQQLMWGLIPVIGRKGFPSWADVVSAKTFVDFLSLASRGEQYLHTRKRRERDAKIATRRTLSHAIDEYLEFKEKEDFSPHTITTSGSILRRAEAVEAQDGTPFGERRLVNFTRDDAERILEVLSFSERYGRKVKRSTQKKHRKDLKALFAWEIEMERMRAKKGGRDEAYSENPLDSSDTNLSKPTKSAKDTVETKKRYKRFYPEEMEKLMEAVKKNPYWVLVVVLMRRLGLRYGELAHLRWMSDVRPMEGGGYRIDIQGGRGRTSRCTCIQCKRENGWGPKNGPRSYVIDPSIDTLGWLKEVADALDAWVKVRQPKRGDWLTPRLKDADMALTNSLLNDGLRDIAEVAGVDIVSEPETKRTSHSLRHTCACELLAAGVSHGHAAHWIGDTIEEFVRTYGHPTDHEMAKAIFGGGAKGKE